jgi:hypothetical protein
LLIKDLNNMSKIAVYCGFIIGMITASVIFIVLHAKCTKYYPQAIDVYQGETTLKYTVIDGIVTDSTVVWKPL